METSSSSLSTNSLSSNKVMQESNNTKWTNEQNTWFEGALAIFDTETPERWSNVAALVPGKTESDVIKQYEKLKADINDIEAGLVPDDHKFNIFRKGPSKFRSSNCVRRKGVPWTEEEHRRFLMGLQVHGKGDWRSISLNFVKTKTSTQVASHAQKYYARQHSDGKEKRRPSIHDMSMVNLPDNTNSLERSCSMSERTAMNYPFEIAKMNNNGGNEINRFEPTRIDTGHKGMSHLKYHQRFLDTTVVNERTPQLDVLGWGLRL
ncbi:putative transcription factor MYB/SANT family [Helianthus annuus]|nr:putative transcription factor MYB/SANT family [Helianthus annuus]